MKWTEAINIICKKLGVDSPEANPDGFSYLVFDDEYEVLFLKGPNIYSLCFVANVLTLPEGDRIDVLKRVAKRAPIDFREKKVVVTLDETHTRLQIFRLIDLSDITENSILYILEQFLNTLENWTDWLGGLEKRDFTTASGLQIGSTLSWIIRP